MKKALISAAFAAGALLGLNASAAVIGFEGIAPAFQPVPVESHEESGFIFTKGATGPGSIALIAGNGWYNTSGSATLVFCSYSASCGAEPMYMSMAAVGGSAFSLLALGAANYQQTGDGTLDLVGHLIGGGTVTATVNASDAWGSYLLSGFSNLSSVDFYGYTPVGVAIDNVSAQLDAGAPVPVPAPGSLALMGLGLAGLAALRRRKGA